MIKIDEHVLLSEVNTNGSSIEFRQHLMIAVTTIIVSQHTELSGSSQKLICVTELENEQFEINVLNEEVAVAGMRLKFRFIRQTVEQLCGWKVRLFKMCGSAYCSSKMIVDRRKKHLFIDVDMLHMPLRSIIRLFSRVHELLGTFPELMKSVVDGLGKQNNTKLLRVNQQASICLSVVENGLCFPSDYAFSANELFVHVSINENEIYLRFDNGWRMFYQSNVRLPFYAYKTPIEVREIGYSIPIPVQVSQELISEKEGLHFHVHADSV